MTRILFPLHSDHGSDHGSEHGISNSPRDPGTQTVDREVFRSGLAAGRDAVVFLNVDPLRPGGANLYDCNIRRQSRQSCRRVTGGLLCG